MLILLKLSSGEEVVGYLKNEDTNGYIIENPLKVMYQIRGPSRGPIVYLHQLMPFADGAAVNFPKQHVLFTANPKKGLHNYYNSVLVELTEASDMIDEQLSDIPDTPTDAAIEEEKDMLLALLQKQQMGNNSIH